MRRKRATRALVVGVASLIVGITFNTGSAETISNPLQEPIELIGSVTESVIEALTARQAYINEHPEYAYELIDELVSPHIDFDSVSRVVLGKYGKGLAAEEIARFEDALRSTLLRAYVSVIGDPRGLRIEHVSSKISPNTDRCSIRYKFYREAGDDSMLVDYRVRLKKGDWMLYDMAIDGVSFLSTYRGSVADALRRSGIESLVERLKAQNRTYQATSPQTLNRKISRTSLFNPRI